MKSIISLTAGFLMSAGAAMADDVQPSVCDPSYELGPMVFLKRGQPFGRQGVN